MLRNILVTLDGSAYSEAILPVVAELAAKAGATITLFSVGKPPSATAEAPLDVEATLMPRVGVVRTPPAVLPHYAETRSQAIERRERELREYLEEKARPLREGGMEVQVAVALGEDAGEMIVERAAGGVELIAMATHGHTGLRSLIFGSVTAKVVGSGVRPVLLVRPRGLGAQAEGREG